MKRKMFLVRTESVGEDRKRSVYRKREESSKEKRKKEITMKKSSRPERQVEEKWYSQKIRRHES